MTILTVGSGQKYTTIAAAVAASASGDTVNVMAGTYTNDFVTIRKNLTIQAVGGVVKMVATVSPPDGKAIITEGAAGITVNLIGLTLTGAKVADGNGAGVRYEGGTLVMDGMTVSGNQEGLLGASDAKGAITIKNSTFTSNGAGDGYTHNIYVGAIDRFTLTGSTISNVSVGHDVKSRAANNVITGNVITDTAGTASYEIDLPNGGNAVISGNVIQKGTNAQNPVLISYGEEGNLYAGGSLTVTNNVLVNDFTGRSTTAVRNSTSVAATVTGNTVYGWTAITAGTATASGNVVPTAHPALTLPSTQPTTTVPVTTVPVTTTPVITVPVTTTPVTTVPVTTTPVITVPVTTTPVTTVPVTTTPVTTTPTTTVPATGTSTQTIVLKMSQDAWQGDALFTVSVDGKQQGGVRTVTASHAAGKSQDVTLTGAFGAGEHNVAVTFINDAYGGTAATDRNLYVDSIVSGSTITKGAAMLANGTMTFIAGTKVTPAAPAAPSPVTVGSGTKSITLQMSEDAWQGDAQFTVKVDGRQIGGVLSTTALHGSAQTQLFDIRGSFTVGPHTVEVAFVNDAYGGSGADRNLYVNKVGSVTVDTAMLANGPKYFVTMVPNN